MIDIHVRKATKEDIPVLVPRLAIAFASQPLTRWVLGEGVRALGKGARVLELDFQNGLPYDLTYTTDDLNCAAIWQPPGRTQTLWDGFAWLVKLIRIVGVSRRLISQLALFYRYEKLFPKVPHYYLSLLAVAPEAQGKGIGSALLRPVLEMCDRRGMHAYTATDTELNVVFYQKNGFRVKDIIPIPDAGSTIWTMLWGHSS